MTQLMKILLLGLLTITLTSCTNTTDPVGDAANQVNKFNSLKRGLEELAR